LLVVEGDRKEPAAGDPRSLRNRTVAGSAANGFPPTRGTGHVAPLDVRLVDAVLAELGVGDSFWPPARSTTARSS
jgi:hypothetical protein